MSGQTKKERTAWEWERSLSLLTEHEILDAYGSDTRGPVEDMLGKSIEQAVLKHNPIWYLALSCWFDNDPSLLWPPFHRDIFCAELLRFHFEEHGDHDGHLFLCPKDVFKTTLGLCYCQFYLSRAAIVEGRHATLCIRHHKEDFAAADLRFLKVRYARHPWVRRYHPELINSAKRFGNDTEFDLPGRIRDRSGAIEPSVYAVGRKTVTAGWKFGLVFNDDLVTEEQLNSEAERQDAKDCYEVGRIMIDAKTGGELTIGHRWHLEDLYGVMLEAINEDGQPLYTRRILSDIDDEDNLLVPNRHSKKWLERQRHAEIARTGSDNRWWAIRQNDPRRAGDVRFDVSWYSWFSRETREWRMKVAGMRKVAFCDTAHKDDGSRGRGDRAAIGIMGLDYDKGVLQKYHLDLAVSNEWDIYDCARELMLIMQRWDLNDGLFFAEEHGQKSNVFVMEREMRRMGFRGRGVRITGKGTDNVKKDRIGAYLIECKAGRVHTDEHMANLERHKTEHESWTPTTEHGDDVVDMWAQSCHPIVTTELNLEDQLVEEDESLFGPQDAPNEPLSRYSPY